jgi:hypothetical protein
MSNRSPKRPKPKKRNRRQTKGKEAESQKHCLITRLSLHSYHALLVTATIVGGLVVLIPRTTVSASDPVDPADAFSSLVTVSNTGYIPLLSVKPYIGMQRISAIDGFELKGAPNYTSRINVDAWKSHRLGLDDKFTFALNDLYKVCPGRMAGADLAVIVDYEIPLIHIKLEKIFPIYARKQTDGHFYWYAGSAAD